MSEPALLLIHIVPVAGPLVVDDIVVRAIPGPELIVQDRKVRVDGPELIGLVEQFLLGAVHVSGHEFDHGVGQTTGQLILDDVDAVRRRWKIARNDATFQLFDQQVDPPKLSFRLGNLSPSNTAGCEAMIDHESFSMVANGKSADRL